MTRAPLPALLALTSLGLFSAIGCSAAPDPGEAAGRTAAPIIKGTPSDASQDAVVLLISQSGGTCTGTLLSPRIVLTARHCVAQTDETSACGPDGKAISGGRVYSDKNPTSLYVFTGTNRPSFGGGRVKANGRGQKLFTTGANTLCANDIALVVLEAPVEGATISRIRLDKPPVRAEFITSVGWGVTDTSWSPRVRQQRANVQIQAVLPAEFQVGESICSGDSGGPALSKDGAVVGVVSRGGNGNADPNSQDPSANCIDAHNLYTRVDLFKEVVMKAFAETGEDPWLEGGPDPRKKKNGEDCGGADECRTAFCGAENGKNVCVQACSADEECPDGTSCRDAGGGQTACLLPAPPPAANGETGSLGGCAMSSSGAGGGVESGLWTAMVAAASAALLRLRRRRSR